ncbi:PAS domain-containing protein, partial [Acinetobacter baumannii]|uniref:PAS domain-containing protein n=1 Tax=Acinetobacter baumannii TaxID=470 RepID=UPI001BB461F9
MRLFLNRPPWGVAVFDSGMHYLALNQPFREALDLDDQDLIGRSHYDVFPEIPERWRDIHRRCLAGAT